MEAVSVWGTDLDGKSLYLGEALSLALAAGYDSPAQGFSASLARRDPCPELRAVTAAQGDRLLFYGEADEQRAVLSQRGALLELEARGPGAAALDNEARPQSYRWACLSDVFRKHLAPYGLTLEADRNPRLYSFAVTKGLSEWEALESFCLQAGLPRPVAVGSRVLVRAWRPNRRWEAGGAGLDLTSVEVVARRCAVLSHVLWRTEKNDYVSGVTNREATRLGVLRKRYLLPGPVGSWSGAREADSRIRASNLAYRAVEVCLPGLLPIAPLDAVQVSHPLCPKGDLVVCECRRILDGRGMSTRLVLGNPAYFE